MRKINKLFLIFLILVSTLLNPVIVSASGDNSKDGRTPHTIEEINELYEKGEWNNVVFNSITNSVIGSEFDFVGAREDTGINAGKDNKWNGRDITVEDGKTYLVRMYVHNNGKSQEDWRETGVGVARDTHAFFSIPKGSSTSIDVRGFIDSSNASPSEYWDNVVFKSANGEQFYLEYVRDSALIENNGYAAGGQGKALSNDIVDKKEGTLIGYDGPDGNVPGCYEYACYVAIRVKVVFSYEYSITTNVRKANTKDEWGDNLNVKVGDEIEYQILYENIGDENQNNVMIRDILPNGIEYISGSTRLWNANYPEGTTNTDDAIATTGINIGNYAPGTNAYIRFKGKVTGKNIPYGLNTLTNWVQGGVNDIVLQDSTSIITERINPISIKSITYFIVGLVIVIVFLGIVTMPRRKKNLF